MAILTVLGVILLLTYIKWTDNFIIFLLLLLVILMDFYLAYGMDYRRNRRAARLARVKGEYRLELQEKYVVYGEENTKVRFADAKRVKFFSTSKVFVLKMDRDVLVIPKRILNPEQEVKVESIVKDKKIPIIEIKIERRG